MTDRERLIELLDGYYEETSEVYVHYFTEEESEMLADYLLTNGIIMPPCKAECQILTAKELHKQKIIPLRMELKRLEDEYRDLYRKECGEKIGEKASCANCAFSCIIADINGHNACMGSQCTCCHSWCYTWTPENEISKFLRKNYPYDSSMFYRLEDVFGSGFLKNCDNPKSVAIVMEMLELIAKFDGKIEDQ